MFLGLFNLLASDPLPTTAVITGVKFVKDGEQAYAKVEGVPHKEVEGSIQHLMRQGWKVSGITYRNERVEPVRDGYRPMAAYLRA